MRTRILFCLRLGALAGCSVLAFAGAAQPAAAAAALNETRANSRFAIPAQDLGTALTLFGRQSDREIVFSPETTRAKKSPAVVGEMPYLRALENILAGSGLTYRVTDDGTIVVLAAPEQARAAAPGNRWKLANAGNAAVAPPDREQSAGAEGERTQQGRPAAESEREDSGTPEVLVRGSRILNMDIRRSRDDAQPYVIFEREAIERSGATDLNEFLKQRLTMNTSSRSNNQAPSATGNTSGINLRGLGSTQTLILVDGHRVATPVTGGSVIFQPDINGIPLAAVERIEILPTSASGIYGGSATGGVVNVVLRRDYTGMELTGSYENTFDSDAYIRRFDISAGLNLNDGATSVLLAGSISDNAGLRVGERDFTRRGRAAILANNPGSIFNAPSPPLGATPNIRSANGSPLFGPGTPNFTSVPAGYAGGAGLAPLQANAGQYNLDLPDSPQSAGARRSLLNAPGIQSLRMTLHHEFSPRLRSFLELSGANNSGRFVYSQSTETFTLLEAAPNNPFGQNVRVTVPGNAVESVFRTSNNDRRAVGGLILELSRDWAVEADYTWSRFRVASSQGAFLTGEEAAEVAVGQQDVLRDTIAFPLDFAQYVSAAPAAMSPPAYFTLRNATVRFAGPVGSWAAGRPQVSVLLERRDEHFGEIIQEFGFLPDVAFLFPEKNQSVNSAYAEVRLPLISGANRLPGFESLDLQIAARHDDYTTAGATNNVEAGSPDPIDRRTNRNSSTNPTVGLRYMPVTDVMLRASYGTGYLPPSVQQLVPSPANLFAGPAFADPRRGNEPLGNFEFISGGNPDLTPEDSEAYTAGIVLTPQFLPGLRFSLDYTHIRKTDNIASFGFQQMIDNEAVLPGRVLRADPQPGDPFEVGPIVVLDLTLTNISQARVEAYDAALDHAWETDGFGRFEFFGQATWQTHYQTQITPDLAAVEQVGTSAFVPLKLKANAGLTWTWRDWSSGVSGRYFDSYRVSTNPAVVANQGSTRVRSQQYYDVFASHRFTAGPMQNTEVRAGIKNVFNTAPPLDIANSFYSPFGDPRLASYYIALTKTFD